MNTLALADALCLSAARRALRHLGADPQVDPRAKGLYQALTAYGVEEGLLRAGSLRPRAALMQPAPYGELILEHAVEDPVALRWLCRGLDNLEGVIRGALLGEQALFPGGDFSLVEQLYRDSPLFSGFARIAGAQVPGGRVLELGAGTGASLPHALQAADRYVFTDVSASLLARAQARHAHPKLRFELLDIDSPWEHTAEVILAVNVLHLSADVPTALRRIRGNLAPGGRLVLAEVSPPGPGVFPWMAFSFGLLPSYWRGQGDQGPLFTRESWRRMLRAAGFQVRMLPLEGLGAVYIAEP